MNSVSAGQDDEITLDSELPGVTVALRPIAEPPPAPPGPTPAPGFPDDEWAGLLPDGRTLAFLREPVARCHFDRLLLVDGERRIEHALPAWIYYGQRFAVGARGLLIGGPMGAWLLATNGEFTELIAKVTEEFSAGRFPEVLDALDHYFGEMRYSLKSLFKDEQKRIIDMILANTLQDAEASYHSIYEKHGALMRFLKEMDQPIPEVLRITTAFVLNSDLVRTFSGDPVDAVRISMLLELVKREGVKIDEASVGFAASNSLARLMRQFSKAPANLELLHRADVLVALLQMLPFPVNYWESQNIYYQMLQNELPSRLSNEDEISVAWVKRFVALGEKLRVSVPVIEPAELPVAVKPERQLV